MIKRDENLLVRLVRKAVGLPTGEAGCCGAAAAPAASACCNEEVAGCPSAECGCESSSVAQHEEAPAQA